MANKKKQAKNKGVAESDAASDIQASHADNVSHQEAPDHAVEHQPRKADKIAHGEEDPSSIFTRIF